MSGDQQASSSFGDPNAQPPTPKQTPTSAVFPSPIFETPKQRQAQFTDPSNWTPRFAEEYSVFNTTPGNLAGSPGAVFADFSSLTQFNSNTTTVAAHKRQLSAEGIAAEIASHATHFSPDSHLPPVDPSRKLQSSPRSATHPDTYSEEEDGHHQPSVKVTPGSRSAKKAKKGKAVDRAPESQIATPPPSSHKGGRKLAPKLTADEMQNDQGYGQPDFVNGGTPQQPGMASFSATDMFGYPMSAPAASGANFWDPSADMASMDLDFSAFGHSIFQTPTQTTTHGHRPMNSFDATQMFQEPSMPEQSQQQVPQVQQPKPSKKERPLAPKTTQPQVGTTVAATTSMAACTFPAPSEDPFGLVSPGGGVNPGLLFSRPQSSSMDAGFSMSQPDPMTQFSMESVAQALSKPPARGDVRRSNSTRELAPSKLPDRAMASSPIKSNNRPGLQRSFSENRGRRNAAGTRNSLPTLAPAIRPNTTVPGGPPSGPSRPPSSKSSGRSSPLKAHNRLSSLTSIPEAAPPRTRTSVKFTIDAKGHARAETTVIVEDPNIVPVAQGRPPLGLPQRQRSYESEDDDSSTDDEPIIIPSRNTSFALPDPQKPSGSFFHAPQRSISERSNSSFATGLSGEAGHDVESEAETVMNESRGFRGGGGGGGDAASELRKVVESRHNKRVPQLPGSAHRSQRFLSGGFSGFPGNTASPASFTDASLFTPSTHAGGRAVRCVCHRNENDPDADLFMVQCESCEMWLHGQCINIPSKRMMPSVYICAFCANTPNMRGGRMRDRGSAPGASPLAHKSFKSFR